MKIAIITPVFPPYSSGIGTVARQEAGELAKRGHGITVFTPLYKESDLEFDERLKDYRIERLRPVIKFGNAAWIRNLDLSGFDVVHLHYPFIGGVRSAINPKSEIRSPKLVVTYHMDLVGVGWKKIFFKIYNRLTLPKIVEKSSKIIFSSWDYGKKSKLKKFIEQKPRKFAEAPFGVAVGDKNQISTRAIDELKKKLGIKDGDRLLIFVGGLDKAHYFKGVDGLIRALKNVKTERVRVLVVGEGDIRKIYENLAKELGLGDRVIFTGRVSDEELPFYYRLARGLVLPSVDKSEAYGMVLLEAMAAGLPVIASHLPGVRVVVGEGDGRRGFLINPGDVGELTQAIDSLLGDLEEAKKMGERARAWVAAERSAGGEAQALENIFRLC